MPHKEVLTRNGSTYLSNLGATVWLNETGLLHKTDGPAIIWDDGQQDFYLFGIKYDEPLMWLLTIHEMEQNDLP